MCASAAPGFQRVLALRAKKISRWLLSNAVNRKSAFVEKRRYLRTNQAGRAGEQSNFSHYAQILRVCLLKINGNSHASGDRWVGVDTSFHFSNFQEAGFLAKTQRGGVEDLHPDARIVVG